MHCIEGEDVGVVHLSNMEDVNVRSGRTEKSRSVENTAGDKGIPQKARDYSIGEQGFKAATRRALVEELQARVILKDLVGGGPRWGLGFR